MTSQHICIFADERSIHTRRWVTGLRKIGLKVSLVTLVKDTLSDFGAISLGAVSKSDYLFKIGKLKNNINKLKPDIFHAHFASSFGFLASFVDHPRKVLSVWGDDVMVFPQSNVMYRFFVNRAVKHANYITATSKVLKQSVLDLNPSRDNITIIPFGIDLDKFVMQKRDIGKNICIGIAKSLRPKYGIDILIRAFKQIASVHENVILKIAGKGEYEAEYTKLVKDLNLDNKISFEGFIQHDRLPEFMSEIDIFAGQFLEPFFHSI